MRYTDMGVKKKGRGLEYPEREYGNIHKRFHGRERGREGVKVKAREELHTMSLVLHTPLRPVRREKLASCQSRPSR